MAHPGRAKILTISDSAARGERPDRSGPALRELLEREGWQVVGLEVVPDDRDQIRERLLAWCATNDTDLVLTTGGTGLGPRDVTPEATSDVLEKEVPGLAEMMRVEGAKQTKRAALSRGRVGVRQGKLILNLAGSPRGACESLATVLEVLPHAVELLRGKTQHSSASG